MPSLTPLPPEPVPPKKTGVGVFPYVLAGLAFIPCVGVPFGLAAAIWGGVKGARSLVLLGLGGILFTVLIYGSLFYFGFHQRGGVYDHLREQMAVSQLDETVRRIELYKMQQGHYPKRLEDIVSPNKEDFWSPVDPTGMERGDSAATFYYALDPSGSFYFLRSVGPDGVPFTADDILPDLSADEREKTGLHLQR